MAEHKKNARPSSHDKHTNRDAGNKQDKKQEGSGWNHMGKNTNHGSNKNQGNNKKNK
jgi:hypothetical protein